MRYILKAIIFILITAESVCILTAGIGDLILYNHSLLLSIPPALIAGAFIVVTPEGFKESRHKNNSCMEKIYTVTKSYTKNKGV
jgi:hypothetical protein